MRNIYFLLKINRHIKNVRIKSLGIFFLHWFGKRYTGIFLDPVYACNLRCRMCYFSDNEKRKTLPQGKFKQEDLPRLANAFFNRALKLQIGCGAEPSLFLYNKELIRLGKEKKVPYISITTNANLYREKDWRELTAAGLDEVTLSLHGVTKQSYEYFMTGASYEMFLSSLHILTDLKKEYPDLKIRINYTVNRDNLQELATFFEIFGSYRFDILQVRPIQQLGNSAYNDFSWDAIYSQYDAIIGKLKAECLQNHVTFMAPGKYDLIKTENADSALTDSTYIYISPRICWQKDFDLQKDTYDSYAKRHHWGRRLLAKVFHGEKSAVKTKKNLNYDIN
jgi:MoaA/NifB/PqqE/SkfB family radical SAM enzyme